MVGINPIPPQFGFLSAAARELIAGIPNFERVVPEPEPIPPLQLDQFILSGQRLTKNPDPERYVEFGDGPSPDYFRYTEFRNRVREQLQSPGEFKQVLNLLEALPFEVSDTISCIVYVALKQRINALGGLEFDD